jgi:hypothetical protein
MVAIAAFVLTAFHPAFFFAPFAAFRQGRRKPTNVVSDTEVSDK